MREHAAPWAPHEHNEHKEILIIEDHAETAEMLTAALEDEGYTVRLAGNGREALDSIAAVRPAMVLLDLQMPVMTGWDVLATLRTAKAGVPVVFMTAGFRAQSEAERCQADGFLAKPFLPSQVFNAIERALSSEDC